MKVTKKQLRRIILEYEQYVDEDGNVYDDEGNVSRRGAAFGRRYGGETYTGTRPPWSGRSNKPRKTSYVGAGANAEQIAAVEALKPKPETFLGSILKQLKAGRGLSSKQKVVVRKIMKKRDPQSEKLFENIAHARHGLGRNLADAEFPIVVGYEGTSEIAYNQEELDDILDYVAPITGGRSIPYSLESLEDLEAADIPVGVNIEMIGEGVMIAQAMLYGGLDVEVDGEYVSIGEMVEDLLAAGDDDIFVAPQGVNQKSLDNLMAARTEERGGPMVGWDSSIFGDYYNVDLNRVIRLYARLHGHQLEERELKSDEDEW